MWLRAPSANTEPVAAADIPAIEQQALAPTAAGSAPAEDLVTGVSPATKDSTESNAPVAPHSASKRSKHQSSNGSSANQAADASTDNAPPALEASPAPTCTNCGVIESVRAVQQKGQGSGVGAVAGGVIGGLVGNQMGKGDGKTAMTVLGAIGGGLAGNEVEKHQKTSTVYEVRIRMDDGSTRTLTQSTQPAVGARVEVDGKTLRPL
ncbi:MAG: glycine zipper 2TM domain-containing protein [Aquabacterium sp.]|nr:glycine zipper 2TM domain-containing protein [Aquabacterium sp.]